MLVCRRPEQSACSDSLFLLWLLDSRSFVGGRCPSPSHGTEPPAPGCLQQPGQLTALSGCDGLWHLPFTSLELAHGMSAGAAGACNKV